MYKLTEFSPIVSVEVGVGKHYKDVDFDYETFTEEANRLDISPEDQGKLSIVIQGKQRKIIRGLYSKAEKRIIVGARLTTNTHLVHEMQHAADDTRGELLHDRRFWIGRVSAIGMVTPPLASTAEFANLIAGNNTASYIFGAYTLLGGAALFAGVIYGYVRHPNEIQADRAAAQSQAQIVKLDPRPEYHEPVVDMTYDIDTAFKNFCRSF